MTASTRKGNGRKRKRKNKLALFAAVFCGVLITGGIGLAVLAVCVSESGVGDGLTGQNGGAGAGDGLAAADGQEASVGGAAAGGRETSESGAADEPETILTKIMNLEGSLLDGIISEPAQETAGKYDALLQDEEAMRAQNIYAAETASPDEIVIDFAGDILFDPSYAVMARLGQRGGDIEEAFSADLLEEMRGADIFMVNNEFPYTDRGTPLEGKQYTFRAAPESAPYLEDMGVDIVSLANNHTFDYGEESLLDSLDTLTALGIPYVGAGRDIEEAASPVSFIMNDKKISILAATQIERNDNPDTRGAGENTSGTFRCWNPDRLLQAIEETKDDCDMLIVFIHWGTENQAEIDWAQSDQAVKIAQAGADLIIGAHSHCLQPVGYAEGVPVVYSLGNFWFNSKSLDTCIVRLTIPEEGGFSVRVLPCKQSDCRTELLHDTEKARVISYINSISDSAALDEEGYLTMK